jgi:hypothetical protein
MSLPLNNKTFDLRSYNNSTTTPDVSLNILPELPASIITTGTFGANVDVYSKSYINDTFTLSADKITSGTLPASRIGADSITSTQISDNTIVDGDINTSANISGSKFANASIAVGKFASGYISDSNISDNQIPLAKLTTTGLSNFTPLLYPLPFGQNLVGSGGGNYFGGHGALSGDGNTIAINVGQNNLVRVWRISENREWVRLGGDLSNGGTAYEGRQILNFNGNTLVYGNPNNGAGGSMRIYTWTTMWNITLTLNGAQTGDWFGSGLAFNAAATRLIIGSSVGDEGAILNVGKVHVLDLIGSTWTQTSTLPPTAGLASNTQVRKGIYVSTSGDGTRVSVGSDFTSPSGLVQIYHTTSSTGTVWTLMATFAGTVTNSYFGFCNELSQDGNTMVCSGWNRRNVSAGVNGVGHVNVYKYNTRISTWELQIELPIMSALDRRIGFSLAVNSNGDMIVTGNTAGANNGPSTGVVRIWKFNGTTWQQVAFINGESTENFGSRVRLSTSGDTLLATGAGWSSNTGRARVFKLGTFFN